MVMINAVTQLSEKGRLVLLVSYQYQGGNLTVGTALTIKAGEGAPYLPKDSPLWFDEVAHHSGVDGCQFLDIIGNENRAGRLLSVEFSDYYVDSPV